MLEGLFTSCYIFCEGKKRIQSIGLVLEVTYSTQNNTLELFYI